MSLDKCIPDLVKSGALTEERGRRMKEKFDQLLAYYRGQMGEAAAQAEASARTVEQLAGEAALKKRQTGLQLAAQARMKRDMASFATTGKARPLAAALALFDHDWKGRAKYSNVDGRRKAILGRAHAAFEGILDKHSRGFLTGAIREKAELDDLVREAFGESSGNASAAQLVKGWQEGHEMLRQRFNAAGGDIGKLENWGFPQHHDALTVRQAAIDLPAYQALERELAAARVAKDAAAEKRVGDAMIDLSSRTWRADILPRLDRARMIDRDTGLPFTDAALDKQLGETFETIRSEGWKTRAPGGIAGGKLANRHTDPRFLIFKSADDWLAYQQRWGGGRTVFDTMVEHYERMARDIAHLEILGPNPNASVKWLNDMITKARQTAPDRRPLRERGLEFFLDVDKIYAATSGALSAPADYELARRFGSVRSLLVASQLGSAFLSAITDAGWSGLTRAYNGMPITGVISDFARQFGKGERRESINSGLIAEEATRLLASTNRYVDEQVVGRKSAWLAERMMKLSLLAPWTQAQQWSFGRGMESTLGTYVDRPLTNVPERFQRALRSYGIGDADWEKIRATPLAGRDGSGFLRPVDVEDRKLGDRLLEMIMTETIGAVPSVTASGRAVLSIGQRPGTLGGELLKSVMQYKSFGASLILTHGARAMAQQGVGKLSYASGAVITGTLLGALVMWLRDIRNGDDPRPADNPGFWGQAMLQGVGFGVFGDYIMASTSERAGSFATAMAGPTVGAMDDAGQFTLGNAAETGAWWLNPEKGRDGQPKSWNDQTHFGREAVRMAKRYTPGSNLWYTRLALQRGLFDQIQMWADPQYRESFDTLEKLHAKQGHPAFWPQGQLSPGRAPNLDNALTNQGAAQ